MTTLFNVISVHLGEADALFLFLAVRIRRYFKIRLNRDFRLVRLRSWQLIHFVILFSHVSV